MNIPFKTTIKRFGGSKGIVIPSFYAKTEHLDINDTITVSITKEIVEKPNE